MASTELVSELIEAGKTLTSALDQARIKVSSAFWFFDTDASEWRLIVAMPLVEDRGPAQADEEIRKALQAGSVQGIFLRQIAAVGPGDELVSLLRKAIPTGPGIKSIRFTRNAIDNVLIEDAYIYRST